MANEKVVMHILYQQHEIGRTKISTMISVIYYLHKRNRTQNIGLVKLEQTFKFRNISHRSSSKFYLK